MDKSKKSKLKKYYIRNSFNKNSSLTVNLKGFLCSCNNREKDCIKESYNILNEYADKLYPVSQEVMATENEDIDDQLSREISQMKHEQKTEKRFQVVEAGAKNFLFIRTNLENPVELAETIVKDIQESGNKKTRFLLRLVPVEITCKAQIGEIVKSFTKLADKHFKDEPQTFSIMFNHRNNNAIKRDEIIKSIADKVFEYRNDHKVDLKTANVCIIVEIIKGFAFLSIIPNYLKYKKYNLSSLCEQSDKLMTNATARISE